MRSDNGDKKLPCKDYMAVYEGDIVITNYLWCLQDFSA